MHSHPGVARACEEKRDPYEGRHDNGWERFALEGTAQQFHLDQCDTDVHGVVRAGRSRSVAWQRHGPRLESWTWLP